MPTTYGYDSSGKPNWFGNNNDIADWTQDSKAGDKWWKENPYANSGWYPIWSDTLTGQRINAQKQLGSAPDPNKTTGGFSGVDYNYFTDLFKSAIEKGDPNQDIYRQNILGGINKSFDTGQRNLKETLAQSGLSRSGVAAQQAIDLEGGRNAAAGQAELGLATQDQAYREQALSKLLGLQEMGLRELGSNRNYSLALQQLLNNLTSQQKQYDLQNNDQGAWGQIAGQGVNALGSILTAWAASDKKLKDNIKEVGKTESGLPIVEFNYKGSNTKMRGHIAQEVEKKFPDAVFKAIDYSKLPIDAVYEVVE